MERRWIRLANEGGERLSLQPSFRQSGRRQRAPRRQAGQAKGPKPKAEPNPLRNKLFATCPDKHRWASLDLGVCAGLPRPKCEDKDVSPAPDQQVKARMDALRERIRAKERGCRVQAAVV